MPVWPLIVWPAVGAIAGLFARNLLGGTPPFGKIGDIILGIASRVVGGFLLARLAAADVSLVNYSTLCLFAAHHAGRPGSAATQ